MSRVDWIVLALTLALIIIYGLFKSRTTKDLDGYYRGNRMMPWYLVLLSIMGTQASAVTFLSAPGQAYTDGMRFVQYYFGLPLAMVVLCITFVPLFRKLKVYTAYEFLEQRFNVQTRTFTAFLFLLQRGLSTGISIYAPSIIVSSLLGWNIFLTNIVMGGLLIIYTVSGGAKAVAYTQQLQLIIIAAGMFVAGYMIIHLMPGDIGFTDALYISGAAGRLNTITTGVKNGSFDWSDKYNIFSGVLGGFFLALSYFGTDQSQVGRYLTAKSAKESKIGLLMNGIVKVPMQFLILLVGCLLVAFYQVKPSPIFFNKHVEEKAYQTKYSKELAAIRKEFDVLNQKQAVVNKEYVQAIKTHDAAGASIKDSVQANYYKLDILRNHYKKVVADALPEEQELNDTNYIFLRFVVDNLPVGIVGLLIAVIFLAAWGSIAAALNALSSCTVIDFHKRLSVHKKTLTVEECDAKEYRLSQQYTLLWGIFSIIVAQFVNRMGSLIEAVNVLGSLFYGVILGIFLVAFYIQRVGGKAVLISAIVSEIIIILLFILDAQKVINLSFLWLNAVGAILVIVLAAMIQMVISRIPHK